MKQFRLLLAISLFALPSLRAQQTFSLTPNPVYGIEKGENEVEGSATVKNLAATTDTFVWTRTVLIIENDPACYTQVTDPYLHWHPQASEKTFWLAPGQEGPLNVTLWDPEASGCCAIAHLKLKKTSGTPDSIESFYYLRCHLLGTPDVPKALVELSPNPATAFFSLKQADAVQRITLYEASGRLLRSIPVNADHRYEVSDLSPGTYYLVLEDKAGRLLQVLPWIKG